MLYNGFVITDNRAFSNPNIDASDKWNLNKLESSYNEESGVYTTPAGPGGGGSTPPTLPAGWSTGAGAGAGAGAGSTPKTGGGTNWQQWLNPETIGAVAGTVGAVAGAVNQNPEKQRIKAACGRKPLFNIGGKKDAYNQCVQNLLAPPVIQQRMDFPQQSGMSNTAKILIGVFAFLLLAAIVVMIIVLSKRKAA